MIGADDMETGLVEPDSPIIIPSKVTLEFFYSMS